MMVGREGFSIVFVLRLTASQGRERERERAGDAMNFFDLYVCGGEREHNGASFDECEQKASPHTIRDPVPSSFTLSTPL